MSVDKPNFTNNPKQGYRFGEVYYVHFEPTSVGKEIKKRRPAIVASINPSNEKLDTIFFLPLSSKSPKMLHDVTIWDINLGLKEWKGIPRTIKISKAQELSIKRAETILLGKVSPSVWMTQLALRQGMPVLTRVPPTSILELNSDLIAEQEKFDESSRKYRSLVKEGKLIHNPLFTGT